MSNRDDDRVKQIVEEARATGDTHAAADQLAAGAAQNLDTEIWRAVPGDHYAPSISVTPGNGIAISCGGLVFVKPIEEWHRLAQLAEGLAGPQMEKLREAVNNLTQLMPRQLEVQMPLRGSEVNERLRAEADDRARGGYFVIILHPEGDHWRAQLGRARLGEGLDIEGAHWGKIGALTALAIAMGQDEGRINGFRSPGEPFPDDEICTSAVVSDFGDNFCTIGIDTSYGQGWQVTIDLEAYERATGHKPVLGQQLDVVLRLGLAEGGE